METQQMMELLLARMDANTKEMKEMVNEIKENINVIRKADREDVKEMMKK
jgi:hypothetical protein